MAQTYVRMGRTDDAKKVLLQVLAANPRRVNDLQVAGELFLQSGDQQRALELLARAEALAPTSRTELLMAIAYQRSNQPDRAEEMLQRARGRSPHDPEVLRAVANYYREVKQFDKAVGALKEIQPRFRGAQATGIQLRTWREFRRSGTGIRKSS